MRIDVPELLAKLGLDQYAANFIDNDIDAHLLPQLTNDDLKEIGIVSLGHRKSILNAIEFLNREDSEATAPPKPKGDAERRQLTVMFCDLVGSTELSSRMDPEEFRELITAYQEICTTAIKRLDGYIARYLGDGLLVYFGYPRAHEDDAERAVRTGLDVIEAMHSMRGGIGEEKDIRLEVRIGIATGNVVVGDIVGEGAAQESTALGETPNLAARLQGLAAPDSIIIAPATRDILGGLFAYKDLGNFELKGISAPVNVFEVLRLEESESRFDAAHAYQLSPLVGRDEQFEILLRRWRLARDGDGQVVLMSGDAGIGKSRIIQALRERLYDEPHFNLRHQCSQYHENSALYPISSRLERAMGYKREDSDAVKLNLLEELLGQATDKPAEIAPLFAALLSIPAENRYPAIDLSPEQLKDRILGSLGDQLFGLARKQPVLCIFEDLHWSDPTTFEYLDSLIEQLKSHRILLVLTSRADFQSSWTSEAHVTSINLNKLPDKTSAEPISNLTANKPLPEDVARQIIDKTDGIPLFIEELTRTVLESELIREEDDRYVLDGPLPQLSIPNTLQDSLMARLDRLADAREIAQIGAVLGREFSHELIQMIAQLPDAELEDRLASLIDADLLFRRGTPPDAMYAFKHALIQDTAYASLLKSRRQQLHASIANTLESNFPDVIAKQPEFAANQFFAAGLIESAIHYWHQAGRQANQRSANVEAYRHLSAALKAIDTIDAEARDDNLKLDLLLESVAPVIAVKGYSAPEIHEIYAKVSEVACNLKDTPQIFPALYTRWSSEFTSGFTARAMRYAEEFLAIAGKQHARLAMVTAERCMATVMSMDGRPAEALQKLQQVADKLTGVEHQDSALTYGQDNRVVTYCYQALASATCGYPAQARAHSEAGLERALELDHTQTLVLAHLIGAGLTSTVLRDAKSLESHADTITAIVARSPMALWEHAPRMLAGHCTLFSGDYQSSVELLQSTVDAFDRMNFHLWKPLNLCHLGEAFIGLGNPEAALASVDRGLQEIDSGRDRWYEAELLRIRSRALEKKNASPEKVLESYRSALTVADNQSAKLFELRAALDLARYWRHCGDSNKAYTTLEPVYKWFQEGFDEIDLNQAATLLGELESARQT